MSVSSSTFAVVSRKQLTHLPHFSLHATHMGCPHSVHPSHSCDGDLHVTQFLVCGLDSWQERHSLSPHRSQVYTFWQWIFCPHWTQLEQSGQCGQKLSSHSGHLNNVESSHSRSWHHRGFRFIILRFSLALRLRLPRRFFVFCFTHPNLARNLALIRDWLYEYETGEKVCEWS